MPRVPEEDRCRIGALSKRGYCLRPIRELLRRTSRPHCLGFGPGARPYAPSVQAHLQQTGNKQLAWVPKRADLSIIENLWDRVKVALNRTPMPSATEDELWAAVLADGSGWQATPHLVEKYRPQKLDDLIAHEDIISTIGRFIKEDRLPHLLFYGPPGTGKTSTILACAQQIYTPKEFGSKVLELNASDDRGIGIVRGEILNFASTKTIFNSGFKLIVLDEADAMTNDAQNALRRVIEKFTENARFCLICNYLSKIIPALQSAQMSPRIDHVITQERLTVTADGKKALMELAQGDMRKALNILQSTSMAFEEVNETNVYLCVGHPLKEDISDIVSTLLNEDFTFCYSRILPYDLPRSPGQIA
ncbi:hypothetical protein HPB48_005823 [Haemaphysalis longicornis]|uniref:AAA+ ATPase domain-containing protein n=1 Tax=Haemaphysalis longicornis TaxID=44386 RepID=A0A9J6GQT7_HAELO|nr:hypothetical protein HPB48_005823 [Haemaphysalis longicornis]